MSKTVVLWAILLISSLAKGQDRVIYTLDIHASEETAAIPKYQQIFNSKELRSKELYRILQRFYQDGYLAAYFDQEVETGPDLSITLNTGQQYNWAEISPGNTPIELLEESGWNRRDYLDKPIKVSDVGEMSNDIVSYFENNGFPFASVQLDSIKQKNGSISATMKLEKGDLFTIDSVIVKGNAEVAQKYLENYIGVKAGDPYNDEKVRAVDTRMEEIPFVSLIRPLELEFSPGKVDLYLYAEKRKSSDINLLIGLVPNEIAGSGVTWVGDGRLRLKNSFKRGELIDANIRRMPNGSQDLKLNFNYPFLFNTDFGGDFLLKLFRRDTTFLELQRAVAVQYLLSGGNYIEAFADFKESSILSDQVALSPTALSQ